MKTIEIELKKLINQKGFYGKLSIDVELDKENDDISLEMDDSMRYWKPALYFGLIYFYEKFYPLYKMGIKVKVRQLDYQPVDSSFIIFVYLMVVSLSKATDFKLNDFLLDEIEGRFIIPK